MQNISVRSLILFALTLLLALAVSYPPAGLEAAPEAEPGAILDALPAIRLQAATFTPAAGERPALPPGLETAGYAPGQQGYYLLQFQGPVTAAWKAGVAATGAELLHYIPDFAFKVRMTPAQARQVERIAEVIWVGLFHPAYKLSPDVVATETGLYRVQVEQGADAARVRATIARAGIEILTHDGRLLTVVAGSAQLETIARVPDVAWIEPFRLPEKHNEYGAGVIMNAGLANSNGYDGSTQIVAVADTGLGGGTAATAHADIPAGRIAAIYDWAAASSPDCYTAYPDGAIDVDSGHGTHVAVSVLGDGDSGIGTGTAPAASLVFQAVEDYLDMEKSCAAVYADGYYLLGLPSDLGPLFQQAYSAGARIHSNSWGSAAAGDYTVDSATADQFTWDNPDMLITFSAGNEGIDANGDGLVDAGSTGSPATAKNVLTVGASENDRQGDWSCDTALSYTSCAFQGGQNAIFTWGFAWPGDYPAEPLFSDVSAGNAQQMAAFSSRGPTDDGRLKPDVVAPGSWILSGYSDMYQREYDASFNPQNNAYQYDGYGNPYSQLYKYMSGTSMSNPLTAGAAAIVRDFYEKGYGHAASAALTKATLINSATDLLDENNDGADDNDYPIPNIHEGWGLVDLAAATDGSHSYVDETAGIGTGQSLVYTFDVLAADMPFKVTLVWSDYPSTAAAAQNLVNDLDLTVTSPGNVVYRGNVFSGGWSQTGGTADRTNNVENVFVAVPETGTWTVTVSGYNVANGPQPFALVVDDNFPALTIAGTPTLPTQLDLTWTSAGPLTYAVYSSTLPYGPFTFVADTMDVTYPVTTATPLPAPDYYQVWIGNVPSANTVGRFPFALQPGTP